MSVSAYVRAVIGLSGALCNVERGPAWGPTTRGGYSRYLSGRKIWLSGASLSCTYGASKRSSLPRPCCVFRQLREGGVEMVVSPHARPWVWGDTAPTLMGARPGGAPSWHAALPLRYRTEMNRTVHDWRGAGSAITPPRAGAAATIVATCRAGEGGRKGVTGGTYGSCAE